MPRFYLIILFLKLQMLEKNVLPWAITLPRLVQWPIRNTTSNQKCSGLMNGHAELKFLNSEPLWTDGISFLCSICITPVQRDQLSLRISLGDIKEQQQQQNNMESGRQREKEKPERRDWTISLVHQTDSVTTSLMRRDLRKIKFQRVLHADYTMGFKLTLYGLFIYLFVVHFYSKTHLLMSL